MGEKTVEAKLYIIKHDGIQLPGVKRDDIRIGATVKLMPEVGDKFAERGFLQDASTVVEMEAPDEKLLRENAKLKEENAKLKEQIASLKK